MLAECLAGLSISRSSKIMNEINTAPAAKKSRKKLWLWVLGIFILVIIIGSGNKDPKVSTERTQRCVAMETPIPYSVLEERDRESDVAGKQIHECYIVIEKVAPTLSDLTNLATALGKGAENIEYKIYDTNEAYMIGKRFREITARNGSESEISDAGWAIWDEHYLAVYLKANKHVRNNRLSPVSDIYAGQEDVTINN